MKKTPDEENVLHQKKKIIIAVLVVVFFCVAGLWYVLSNKETAKNRTAEKDGVDSVFAALTDVPESGPTGDGSLSGKQDAGGQAVQTYEDVEKDWQKEEITPMIYVYVCGAVAAPGVYEMPEGSRLYEAIACAGGCTPKADEAYHNLAREVFDGERIYILSKEESEELSLKERVEGETVSFEGTGVSTGVSSGNGCVNLNTATIAELTTLPGIGESRAESIIAYRNKVGKFLAIEEIMNISGIGESMFEKIKDRITVE